MNFSNYKWVARENANMQVLNVTNSSMSRILVEICNYLDFHTHTLGAKCWVTDVFINTFIVFIDIFFICQSPSIFMVMKCTNSIFVTNVPNMQRESMKTGSVTNTVLSGTTYYKNTLMWAFCQICITVNLVSLRR